MQISISIKNADIVAKKLQDLRYSVPRIAVESIAGAIKQIIREMQDYPPPPSGSRYVRTYKLKNSWKATQTSSGYKIENKARNRGKEYARYVVGNYKGTGQAKVHVGRWLLFRDVVEYYTSKLPPKIEQRIALSARAKGL